MQINNILKIGCSGYNKPMTSCNAQQMSALEQYGADMRTALAPLITNPAIGTPPFCRDIATFATRSSLLKGTAYRRVCSSTDKIGKRLLCGATSDIQHSTVGVAGMFTPSCIAHCQSVENEHPMALWYWSVKHELYHRIIT